MKTKTTKSFESSLVGRTATPRLESYGSVWYTKAAYAERFPEKLGPDGHGPFTLGKGEIVGAFTSNEDGASKPKVIVRTADGAVGELYVDWISVGPPPSNDDEVLVLLTAHALAAFIVKASTDAVGEELPPSVQVENAIYMARKALAELRRAK